MLSAKVFELHRFPAPTPGRAWQLQTLRSRRRGPARAMAVHPVGNAPSMTSLRDGFMRRFEARNEKDVAVAIMGDLHLEPAQMHLFHEARDQLLGAMSGAVGQPLPGARIVQLGDLGGYKDQPGSRACFRTAKQFLDSFATPFGLILGNHDLEGEEFQSDPDNLAAWHEAFDQPHYWAAELGPFLAVGLSTVRFRSNKFSVHEVFIDEEQLAWFESVLQRYSDRPVVVFTHAPPMGSGLKVVQDVHVKNRCAWLNHSATPQRFIRLVETHPNVRLWFSGHFHLSQNYPDSISVVGRCAFVQTGVIGECNRDGSRQSRLLKADADGYQLYSMDHGSGQLRLDLEHGWRDPSAPLPNVPVEAWFPERGSGWLSSSLECGVEQAQQSVRWFPVDATTLLALQDDLLVEYDMPTRSPVGLVAFVRGREVRLVTDIGADPVAEDGSDASAVVLTEPDTQQEERIPRNDAGTFYRLFQANKWVIKQREKAQQQAAVQARDLVSPAAHR